MERGELPQVPGDGPSREAAGASPLPCQDSLNSIVPSVELSASQKKVARALEENVRAMVAKHGLPKIGFLTLTFSDPVQCIREAQRRYNSLATNVLRDRYAEHICVVERQKSGRVHFHLLVVCAEDIKTGVDFEAFARGDYRTAGPYLRKEWKFWRETAPRYSFGRTELMPIRSGGDAIAAYVGKYIAKHIGQRLDLDKRAKLVRYSRGSNRWVSRFSWNSVGAQLFRRKMALLVGICRAATKEYVPWKNGKGGTWVKVAKFRQWYGPRWAYKMRFIWSYIKLPVYPTGRHYNADHKDGVNVNPDLLDVWNWRDQSDVYAALARCVPFWGMQLAKK